MAAGPALRRGRFRAREFLEGRDGRCRLTPPLAHELAAAIGRWRSLVAPIVERLVDFSSEAPIASLPRWFGLTAAQGEASACWHRGPRAARPIATTVDRRANTRATPVRIAAARTAASRRGNAAATAASRRYRSTMRRRSAAGREWPRRERTATGQGPPTIAISGATFCPGCKASRCAGSWKATGLSKRFASQIRNGLAVPHRRHWDALLVLLER